VVDPALRLHDVKPMDEVGATLWPSFTVSRRTREIGIRVALGAHARQIVVVIFARAFAQVVFGIGAGGAVVLVLTKLIIGLSPSEVAAIGAYMALMLLVCLLACILPSGERSAWNPAEALRVDGLDGTGDQ
jgi:putative ABC transport system permease protein